MLVIVGDERETQRTNRGSHQVSHSKHCPRAMMVNSRRQFFVGWFLCFSERWKGLVGKINCVPFVGGSFGGWGRGGRTERGRKGGRQPACFKPAEGPISDKTKSIIHCSKGKACLQLVV